jgi:FHA domain-containing protein
VPTCPVGHDSTTDDYCDTCGRSIGAAPAPTARPGPGSCAVCGAVRDGRFCEECGHDSAVPAPDPVPPPGARDPGGPPTPPPAAWTAVVRADRAWFEEVRRRDGPDVATVEFPRYCPERRFGLAGREVQIGRRSRSRGTDPQIDLSGPPLDPGVSAQHALLVARDDGGWDLVDLNSTNGTALGDPPDPLTPHTPVPLSDGARIRLGAWTTITVEHRRAQGP